MKALGSAISPNIGIDCRYLNARPSGIGEVVSALVKHLPALAPEYQFLMLCHPDRTEPLSNSANVREVTVSSAANSPTTLLGLDKVVDLTNLDLFHAPANIQPGRLSMPCVTTVHDIMWLTNPEWCNPRWWGQVERRFYRYGIRKALRQSAMIATVSEATRQEILRHWPNLEDRVAVTRSGVSEDFAPAPYVPQLIAEAGLDPGRRFCLVVGQYAPYKNHEIALAAFAAAFGNQPDHDLVLVQRRGNNSRALQELAQQHGIAGRVHFPRVPRREVLIQLYCAAEVLLHPSLCEGFGNPIAEAMACGCPVITSNISAMPEVAGDAALLVNPRDVGNIAQALRTVADDPAVRADMSRRGIARAKELDWRDFAAANLAIYRRVLAATCPA